MTDRELLEYAAKAAGIEIYESTDGTIQNRPVWVFRAGGGMGTMPYEEQWNPLREDAQAFRLAVKLGISIDHDYIEVGVFTYQGMTEGEYEMGVEAWKVTVDTTIKCEELHGNDPLAATRRAIVRAAAAIGKGMV